MSNLFDRRGGKSMTMRPIVTLAALAWGLSASSGFADDALTPTAPPPLDSAAPVPPVPVVAPLAPATPPAPLVNNTVTTLNTFSVGNWNAYAYSLPGSQGLNRCVGDATYKDGLTLGFWVDRNYQWGIYLVNSAWRLAEGQSYAITFSIDNSSSANAQASATTSTEVSIPLPGDSALFKRFMQGSLLSVVAAETTFSFLLTDTSQFLPALLNCVDGYVGPSEAAKAANPFQSMVKH